MKRSSIGFIVFLVVAIGIIYGLSKLTSRKEGTETSSTIPSQLVEATETEQSGDVPVPSAKGTIYGPQDAKVKVVAILPPSGCQMPNLRILREIARAEPKRVRVEIYGMGSEKAQEVARQYGASCASIFINGKNAFTVKTGGKVRNVVFKQSPGGYYQSTDLIEVIHEELQKAYGEGFSEKTLNELRDKGRKFGGHGGEEVVESQKQAKVVVEVLTPSQKAPIYPLFSNAVKKLEQLKEKYGNDLAVTVYSLMTEEGQQRMRELKLNGPAIVINGKTAHEIQGQGGKRRTIITGYSGGTPLFSISDIEEIVKAYMQQAKKK